MTPKERLELLRNSHFGQRVRRGTTLLALVAPFMIAGGSGALVISTFRHLEHRERLEVYKLCLDLQLRLADRLPKLLMLEGCRV